MIEAFSFEGVNRSNAVVNFTEEDPFDAKAVWLNAEHHPHHAGRGSFRGTAAGRASAGSPIDAEKMLQITPLIQERIRLLNDVLTVADFFFVDELAPYDTAELIPKKGDAALALRVLEKAHEVLATAEFTHDGLEAALRAARPKRLASKPVKCSSPFAWPCAAAKPRRRCSEPWKSWAATPASCASKAHRETEKLKHDYN